MSDERYELYYWPGLPGRGEFIRLALADAGVPWTDVVRARQAAGEDGVAALLEVLQRDDLSPPPFAPPILHARGLWISHVAVILDWLGGEHGLAPSDEAGRLAAHQLQLTLTDFVAEAHDTHHPGGSNLAYEEQTEEALVRSKSFREARAPKFLGYFERVVRAHGEDADHLVAGGHSYVDLSLAHVLDGLAYAFPRAFAQWTKQTPRLIALRDRVFARERVAAYRASDEHVAFNEHGIFRHYPELDGDA
jgi:glutathione S-transferase